MNAIKRLAIVVALGGCFVFAAQQLGGGNHAELVAASSHPLVGSPAPDFSLRRVSDGQPRALADHRGEVLVLDFWAAYCRPCREAMPMLDRVHDTFKDRGVTMIGINVDSPDPSRMVQVEAWINQYDVDYDVLLDAGATGYAYGARRIPYIVVVDANGVVSAVHQGGRTTEAGLIATIEQALDHADPS